MAHQLPGLLCGRVGGNGIVQAYHAVSTIQQLLTQVGTDESGPAGYQYCLHFPAPCMQIEITIFDFFIHCTVSDPIVNCLPAGHKGKTCACDEAVNGFMTSESKFGEGVI